MSATKSPKCGNCVHFVRVKDWGNGRNGMCGKLDFNCLTDSAFAKKCEHFQAKRFSRKTRHKKAGAAEEAIES